MSFEVKNILEGKRILVLGYGKEGRSTASLLRKWFPELEFAVADQKADAVKDITDDLITIIHGEDYMTICNDYDLVIKSPGIPFEKLSVHCDPTKITSQTDLFLRAYGKRVIGVTGTKGKSTVTSLIHHILVSAGRKALLAGNIGVPSLDLAEEIDTDSLVVFEMSSHQLEHISIAPHIAVILNVFPEHLDHYEDFTAYKMAKFNISLKQADGGSLVFHLDDTVVSELISEPHADKKLLSFSLSDASANAYISGNMIKCPGRGKAADFLLDDEIDMPGDHNRLNLMAAVLVCLELDVPPEDIRKGMQSYKRLEHRLEYVGNYGGVTFYNDSIATIPEACIEALNTLEKVDFLLLGGYDRQLEYDKLYHRLSGDRTPFLIFMGDAGKRMYGEWSEFSTNASNAILVEGMDQAFSVIREKAKAADVCLLSPAAASYGMFKNFEERGKVYKKMAAAF